MDYKKLLRLLIAGAFLFKCLPAGFTELNNDEAYYRLYALQLDWNYFDHPPMIAVLLKIFTGNLLFQQEFFLRLGIMVCAAISTWLVYSIGRRTGDEQTGLLAAFLFTASPYCSVIAGLLVIPDGPQLVFGLWSVLLMIRIACSAPDDRRNRVRLLLLGCSIGCCMLSKVHGVFLWVGFILYILLYQRRLLLNPYLYCAGIVTALFILPVLYWNISHHFITWQYHSNRVHLSGPLQPDSFFRELLGEFLYNNPVSFVLLLLSVGAFARGQVFMPQTPQRLLFLLGFPLIAVVIIISLFNDTLPHWTGPAYTTLIPFTAAWLRSRQKIGGRGWIPGSVRWALAFTAILLLPAIAVVKWLPANPGKKEWQYLGEQDPTLDMNGFREFAPRFDSLYASDRSKALIGASPFMICDYWFPAAHMDYYVARRYGFRFLAIGGGAAIHQYAWVNESRPFLRVGDDAYFITVSNYFAPPSERLSGAFETVSQPVAITQYRSGVAVRNFFVYRMRGYKGGLPGNGVVD
ncbi:MAG: glycosyltransferase family 39 protein [Bacteroidetes bacterium]|nr:glycosyltransferase family 39 protein [Bacteroidota bacterium]